MCKTALIVIVSLYCFLFGFGFVLEKCPPGFSCPQSTSKSGRSHRLSEPIPCEIGTYSEYGDGVCTPCAPGFYTLKNGSASCKPCPRGSMCKYPNRSPKPCLTGTYSFCIAQESCSPCPIGLYSVNTGSTICAKCPAGSRCNSTSLPGRIIPHIPPNARWSQKGTTVAGGNGRGSATNQLYHPFALFVDDDQTLTIADHSNHRIMQWKKNDTNGQVIAGGNGPGNQLNQLYRPTDVLIDKETNSLIIADRDNRRVMRWSRLMGTTQGEILINNIACWGLALDNQRYLYVTDIEKHEVRRYKLDRNSITNVIVVTGGNGPGAGLNQLNFPIYLFVDQQQNVYVSDHSNHRVMKWTKDAKEGIVVAGGNGAGSALTQLYHPHSLFVDNLGTLYIADNYNFRVQRWPQGALQGTLIVGANGWGADDNQLIHPVGLSFDRHGNLYVADFGNYRVQRFAIE